MFIKTANTVPKAVATTSPPTGNIWVRQPLPKCGAVSRGNFSHSGGHAKVSHYAFVCL